MESNTNTENEAIAELKNKILKQNSCDLSAVFKIIGGKWKILLIKSILHGCPKRFGELRRELEDLAQTTLTTQLRELERDGIISRKIYAETPPRVEYKLTPLGLTLIPVVQSLEDWWHQYNEQRTDV
ncbi:transcriptional regulator, HxlR family [Sphingobacterium spiritivorum ATCC 33300]|uniref:Transcriptional regulator, HxlR family n=1 Tax=Sphingobacterium spiritivorum ATCC 33300 TaxID=525372 RepID=C2FVG9_SPHSI|nr:helix-turn-helix domain-containing protein [Sphingobacterium spiritivorum]EEI93027.1 transcriptional regulator, HxlR family [Sphingobacterium spiritivorum ATCC 33300]QQS96179.1 helix-turn-helix transcriptional regulator [Sphingobacterium spiritivorum]